MRGHLTRPRRAPEPVPTVKSTFAEIPGTVIDYADFGQPEPLAPAIPTGQRHIMFIDDESRLLWPQTSAAGNESRWTTFSASIPNGHVSGYDGAILWNDEVVYQSLWDINAYSFRLHERKNATVKRKHVVVEEVPVASILSLWSSNYYHWLLDCLPRLAVLNACGWVDTPIAVPRNMSAFQRDSLDIFAPGRRQVVCGPKQIQSSRIVWASSLDPIGYPSSRSSKWIRDTLQPIRERKPETQSVRLYIRRRVRGIANEDQIVPILTRFGFEMVEPEKLSFPEQVEMFSTASVVFGVHGAGMANAVVSRSGTLIIEVFQPGYVNLCTSRLLRSAGHKYFYMIGAATGRRRLGSNGPILVDPLELTAALEGI